jgi:protein SCO1/2
VGALTFIPRALIAAIAALMVACNAASPRFKNADITGVDYGKDFALVDQQGKPRHLSDFKGRAVVMFFGYTHCPDVCPTTLLELKQVMQQLGPEASRVQVLFVTLDPERDSPEVLGKYVPSFDPGFIGLSGKPDEVAAVAKDFKVFAEKVPGKTPGSYTIDHTAGIYVFDPQGRLRLFARPGKPEDLRADLQTLLAASRS